MSLQFVFHDVSLNAFCLLSKMFSLWFQTLLDAFHMHLELIYYNSESILHVLCPFRVFRKHTEHTVSF